MLLKKYILLFFSIVLCASLFAQETKKDVKQLSKNDVLEMTIEELSFYDLEELTTLMDLVGASSLDELYELLLNKDVTSASKSAESIFDSPLSTTVLSHDQIIASGATCFEEALRMVPGVIVREKTNGNFDVHIRGNDNLPGKNMMLYSENSQTLVMINGRPVFNYSHGGTLWESLPVSFEDVDRIEVVRGPSSALYGPNAVSGVINIITADITSETPLVSGNFQGGSLSTYIGDIAFRKQINNKLGFGITGNYETRKRENDEIYVYNGLNSSGEKKYLLNGNAVGNDYYSLDEIRNLYVVDKNNTYKVFPEKGESGQFENGEDITIFGPDKVFAHPEMSKERYAINGYIEYTPNKETSINLSTGYQNSDVLTSTMGDMPTPYSGKESTTSYIDLRATIKDFSFQANYNGGAIDFMAGNEGFKLDLKQYNATAEYNLKLNKIDIRPGLNYQHISYDDSPYILSMGRGYLNGKKDIEIMAGSIRLDYKPTDKLRLISALRTEKYNYPNEFYTSWQFVGSYKANDNNLFRIVYSRANQSSFLVNAHSNYTWNLVNRSSPKVMQFNGNKEYDLLTTDMIELGYRMRPTKSVLIDIEAFYNTSNNFGALMPSQTSLAVFNPLDVIQQVGLPDVNAHVTMEYQNTEVTSKQKGVSVSIDWVVSEKLIANGHFTLQQTNLDNYNPNSRDEVITYQAGSLSMDPELKNQIGIALSEFGAGVMGGTIDPSEVPYVIASTTAAYPDNTQEDNYEHKATPSYFGGFSLTYRPIKKLEIFPQAYFYGDQTFENQYGTIDIDSKFLLNAKVSYKATENLTLFLNGRNILNNRSVEFAYMDETPAMVLVGLNFKL
ncbi:TonB-dependent receptor plug domain-containing protein [Labilibacter marinus]|uniref:TonB-dependent receptor plug domain-containing protein n=1 Tax=Labilibacter marinus TaxID=1477105 RepID=UPI00082DE0E5|nr:TonB-dependent receptor [Labilibacter marinus]